MRFPAKSSIIRIHISANSEGIICCFCIKNSNIKRVFCLLWKCILCFVDADTQFYTVPLNWSFILACSSRRTFPCSVCQFLILLFCCLVLHLFQATRSFNPNEYNRHRKSCPPKILIVVLFCMFVILKVILTTFSFKCKTNILVSGN